MWTHRSRCEGPAQVCCSATRGLVGSLPVDGVRRGSNMSAHCMCMCRPKHVGHCNTLLPCEGKVHDVISCLVFLSRATGKPDLLYLCI